jgi:hypothetical protein
MRNFEVISDSWKHAASVVEEEHSDRVPEERLLQEVLQPKRQEVTGDWRKLRNEELHENCCRLGYYATSSDNFVRTLRDSLFDS